MTSNEKPVRDNNGRFIKWHKPLYVPKYFCRKGYIPPTAFKKGSKAPETAFKKGQIPWNKGLTRAEDKRISGSWNKGLTCKTDERLKEMGKSLVIAHKKGKFGPNTGFQKKDKHYNWNGGNKAYWRKKAREKAEAEQRAIEEKARIEREKLESQKKATEDKARKEKEIAAAEKKKLEAQLKNQIECPNCHHKFQLTK